MKKALYILTISFFLGVFIPAATYSQVQKELWGMTAQGGNGGGVIFKTDSNGNNQEVVFAFLENPGGEPDMLKLCEATNGKLYGLTYLGGAYNRGVLFEYDPLTNTYDKKIDFDGIDKGSGPYGSLIQASNGKLYGMTYDGGANFLGVLFEYTISTNTFIKKLDFSGTANGSEPKGSLVQAANGKLYGLTSSGGADNKGVLFEYDPATDVFSKKVDFYGTNNGGVPNGSLILAANGKLYGMTSTGGAENEGVLFEFNPANDFFSKKVNFDGFNMGGAPMGTPLQAANGILYGLTYNGGTSSKGVLFSYNIATDTYTKLVSFDGPITGSNPYGSLVQASNGKLFGMTSGGGANGDGTLFEFDTLSVTLTTKFDFDETNNGSYPLGTLIQATNGKLYGVTQYGGTTGRGILFEYNPAADVFTKKLDFSSTVYGGHPKSSLVMADNGKLYGLAPGGINNDGVLFEFDAAANVYTKKIDFELSATGSDIKSTLVKAANGKLYGMATYGGLNMWGVLFEYDPATNAIINKHDFGGSSTEGKSPSGSLIQANNGKLYGLTLSGGTNDRGTLFEYVISTNTYTEKFNFDGTNNGAEPYGDLVQADNGKLYGMTAFGGATDDGVLFEYDPDDNIYVKKFDFDGATRGGEPNGSLVQAANGNLYGMTYGGGANFKGVLFEYNIATDAQTVKIDFDGAVTGSYPEGTLMSASNEKLYGMTASGGANSRGVLFEFDPVIDAYSKKLDFDMINGANPYKTALIEIEKQNIGMNENTFEKSITVSPNPAKDIVTIDLGAVYDFVKVKICDMQGKEIVDRNISHQQTFRIDLDGRAGLYLLEIISKNNRASLKFIKN